MAAERGARPILCMRSIEAPALPPHFGDHPEFGAGPGKTLNPDWGQAVRRFAAMASTAVTVVPRRDAVRDPVLLLPAVVGAGLAIGWLGIHEHVSGARIIADLALAWSLVAGSLITLQLRRWRAAAWLLTAASFALLGADLAWTDTRVVGTIGVL